MRAARQAGNNAPRTNTPLPSGTNSASRFTDAARPKTHPIPPAIKVPRAPLSTPSTSASPSTSVKRALRRQPSARRIPNSGKRPCTDTYWALKRKSRQATSITPKSSASARFIPVRT